MAEIIDFAEAKAARLRKEDSAFGRMFRELEGGSKMESISTALLLKWADRLNRAKDSETMAAICQDIENIIDGKINA